MRLDVLILLALALSVAGPPAARGTPPAPVVTPTTVAGTFGVTFAGTSTLHGFEGRVPAQPLALRPVPGASAWTATARVPVAVMTTDNARRDAGMRTMLEADRFPEITAAFAAVDVATARGTSPATAGALPFVLRIRDVEQPIVGATSAWREDAGRMAFDVHFPVSLAAFGLTPPSVLGLIRVGDVVDITVHVELQAAGVG